MRPHSPHLPTLGLFVGSAVFTLLVFKVVAIPPLYSQPSDQPTAQPSTQSLTSPNQPMENDLGSSKQPSEKPSEKPSDSY